MTLRSIIPKELKEQYKLYRVQKKYGFNINSFLIHHTVTLGRQVFISEGADLRASVKIGDFSYVNKGTLIASGIIGKYCSIGYNVQIGIFEHPTSLISTSPFIYQHRKLRDLPEVWSQDGIIKPPVIGNDVWIGSSSIVKQGVVVGDGSVIGMGAIVTKDVPPYSIVAGVPARVIKRRFSEEAINLLMDFKWWDKSDEWVGANVDKLVQPEIFINFLQSQ